MKTWQAKHWRKEIEALQNGRMIQRQFSYKPDDTWHDVDDPNFGDDEFNYRVKPDPCIEAWMMSECRADTTADRESCWVEAWRTCVKHYGIRE
jgi:hypothetical protein